MPRSLTSYEQETTIGFNKAEDIAYIFTYEKTWQKHLEGKLGLKPVMDNGFGGRSYEVPKKSIKPPRAPKKLSAEAKAKLAERAKGMHQKGNLRAETSITTVKSNTESKNKGRSISPTKKRQKIATLS